MKHLKRFNESQDSYTKEELKDLIMISLEDNDDFDVVDLFITDATANKHDTRMMLRIDESFSNNVEIFDLEKQAIDKSDEFVKQEQHMNSIFIRNSNLQDKQKAQKKEITKKYKIHAEYLELESKLKKEILEINKKVLNRLCKKYDLEIQTLEVIPFNTHPFPIYELEESAEDDVIGHKVVAVIYHSPGLYN